ncbi:MULTISPECIES: ATP-binding protein [unclassified Tolypothrix]|uniref:ATP-binding protein n=1 Tax=unclassified Tolypothrix TaxID=2649714 RepID=UPI0005EABCCE|nr:MULTISPECIES: ATP-binding protein [unclassified Tolypothrix]BAY93755.1 hypothetical protein NIES3275_57970 [Microchaete diplosiphon NIES-3275]EKF03232.1 hypothetical protein FDUTEX481_02689 [Tolypothrix sp. PCC 7601]MBE9087853.1 ATP-binding protein [Tolypothrix sp. LEGE 11397]UYD27559.1 ATP-binding protein [Tolypothrix sp. PCC 7712]UYD36580.1 ATP-binding protein [Tolypothrix sp. PCC 7601]
MTSLVHGQPISAEEIERIVSREFSPQTFVLLCNSIAWASAGKKCYSLPSFTERIYVPDRGRDAEWTVEIAPTQKHLSAFLSSGWNVYQYKHRDVSARNKAEIFSKLKADLKGALKDFINRNKRQPNKYVLFINIHLTLDEQSELKAKILDGYDETEVVAVEVVEAALLASALNSLPQLRSSFFSTAKFTTWQKAWFEHHENKQIYGANISLTGRDEKLNELRKLVDNPNIRAIVLSGAKDIGKTRLVLEVTKHLAIETVIAKNRSIEVSDLLHLESSDLQTIVVVEDPDPSKIKELVNQILSSTSLKLIVTLPTSENSPTINFGLDERVKNLKLSPLSQEESRELLKASKADFDYGMESWIIKQAGGNPGIILLAAKRGSALRKEHESFVDQIAMALEQEIRSLIDNYAVEILKLLSLLEYVEIEGRANREIRVLCKWFGQKFQSDEVTRAIKSLAKAGFLQIRGLYAEVTPPLLANHLAASLLQGRRSEFLALFADLSQKERSRLIQRLQELQSSKIAWFWKEIFGSSGLLPDLPTALANREILHLAACANPDKTINLIQQCLGSATFEYLKSLQYSQRDSLVWALEELIFRERTSLRALYYLGLLAETEPANYNNSSATSKFCQCFRPLHPQVPLSLKYRLDLLKKFASAKATVASRLLAIEVIKTTLNRLGYHFLHEGRGNQPFDPRPQMTWGDVWSYQKSLLTLLVELVQSDEPQVADAARLALPTAIAEFSMLQFSPEITVSVFQTAVDWVTNQQIPLAISKLADALHSVYDFYKKDNNQFNPETRIEVEKLLENINTLIESLNTAEFAIRLKRWASNWTRSHNDYELDENGKHIYRSEKEAQTLAEEVISKPSVLTTELLEWLCSVEAQEAHNFCFWLGKLDSERRWLAQIEQLGMRKDGINVFSAYFGGLSQIDRQFVSDYLDQLTQSGQVKAEAIVCATQQLGGDITGVNRMVTLIRNKRVDPKDVEYILEHGKWLNCLNSSEYLYLLEAIAGSDLENAAAVVKSFFIWLHPEKAVDGKLAEFAWKCLEASDTSDQDYYFDRLALHLVQANIAQGFRLLEQLLVKQLTEYKCWNPINSNHQREFWEFLYSNNRRLAICIPLKVALQDTREHSFISWHLHRIINQEKDSDLLIEFALNSEEQARSVCHILSIQKSNFWYIAFAIITQYPESQDIKDLLSYLVVEPNLFKSRLQYLESSVNTVEQALSERNPPFAARLWLEELASELRIKVNDECNSQQVADVSSQLPITDRRIDAERIWAIRRLLRDGEIEKVSQLLLQDELPIILAMSDLSDSEKQQLQSLFKLQVEQPVSSTISSKVYIASLEKLTIMSEQSPIFNQQHATIGVNYAAEGSQQQFTQNINTTEQNFEDLLTHFKQFIHNLQQEYPDIANETDAYHIIDVKAKEQALNWQKFLQLKRLWNGGKKAAIKISEHFTEQNPWGKGAIAFLEGVIEEPK